MFTKFLNISNHILYEIADPRNKNRPFIDPIHIFLIEVFYLLFTLKIGPKLMKNQPPFNLKKFMIVFNVIEIVCNFWIFKESLAAAWLFHYKWCCEPVNYSYEEHPQRVARGVYIFYLLKLFEMLDTIVFVLRKKNSQITFLHVYHHAIIAFASWGTARYYPGGHMIFMGLLNSFIHIVMYSYYLCSAIGVDRRKLWWKQYITLMQIVQFVLILIHDSEALIVDCGYPKWGLWLTMFNDSLFLVLFFHFYVNTYYQKKEKIN